MYKININLIYSAVWITVICSAILLFQNLLSYDQKDIIRSYEEQIRIIQDKSLVETISNSSFTEHTNEISGEAQCIISTGTDYCIKCIYSENGSIVHLQITTVVGLAWAVAILLGSLLGCLASVLICLGIDLIIAKRGDMLCKK